MDQPVKNEQEIHNFKDDVIHDIEHEITLTKSSLLSKYFVNVMEKFAQNRYGQYAMEFSDRIMRIIEDTTKWSLPKNNNSQMVLIRPLPWIFFLILIIVLRCTRLSLNIIANIFGSGPITPYSIIYYLQTQRRKLRAIRVRGLKAIRLTKINTIGIKTDENISTLGKMINVLSSAICRPGKLAQKSVKCVYASNYNNSSNFVDFKKPVIHCNVPDEENDNSNFNIDEILTKFVNQNSDEDSDFVPNTHKLVDSDSSLTSDTISSDESINKEDENEILEMKTCQNLSTTKYISNETTNNITDNKIIEDINKCTNGLVISDIKNHLPSENVGIPDDIINPITELTNFTPNIKARSISKND